MIYLAFFLVMDIQTSVFCFFAINILKNIYLYSGKFFFPLGYIPKSDILRLKTTYTFLILIDFISLKRKMQFTLSAAIYRTAHFPSFFLVMYIVPIFIFCQSGKGEKKLSLCYCNFNFL